MIINDFEQLRNVPVGEVATLIVQFMPVRTEIDGYDPCGGCILNGSGCDHCSADERPDKEEVKFVKI